MNTRQLRYFIAIVDEGSFSKAANKLHIAQPALSQHIVNLEKALNAPLLIRSAKGVTPTAAGEVLYQHARKIEAQMAQAVIDVRLEANTPKGEVSVVLPPMLGEHIGPPLWLHVREHYPEISLRIMQAFSLSACAMIDSGRVDLAILSHDHSALKSNMLELYREPLFMVRKREAHETPQDDFAHIHFDDLCQTPLAVTREKHAIRYLLDQTAREQKQSLNIVIETDAARLHRGFIRHGAAAAVLPWPSFHRMWMHGDVVAHRIVEPDLIRHIVLAWPKHGPLNSAGSVVRDTLLDLLKQLFKAGIVRADPVDERLVL